MCPSQVDSKSSDVTQDSDEMYMGQQDKVAGPPLKEVVEWPDFEATLQEPAQDGIDAAYCHHSESASECRRIR